MQKPSDETQGELKPSKQVSDIEKFSDNGIDLDRVDVSKEYDSNLWEEAKKLKLQILKETHGQTTVDDFLNCNTISDIIGEPVKRFTPLKSIQNRFKQGGELIMEQNPDFSDVEEVQRPKDTVKEAEITGVVKAPAHEIFELEDDEEPRYGDRDDEFIQIEAVVDHEGEDITVVDSFKFYENYSPSSTMGKFFERYDAPVEGKTIKFDFDNEGQASFRLD